PGCRAGSCRQRARRRSPGPPGCGWSWESSEIPSAPDLFRDLDDQAQLGDLVHERDVVALDRAGEPHCGLKASWSSGAYFAACSMRRLRSDLLSSAPSLVVT